jgi:dihydrofolate reductase
MNVSLIVAVAENGVIGRHGQLPWHLPLDLRRFKQLTMGHTLVMGRKTFESIGRALPGRTSIVISRDASYPAHGCLVATSWESAIERSHPDSELFVIGGRQIYQMALERAGRIYWTHVQAAIEGDAFFPPLDWSQWRLINEEPHAADSRHAHDFVFKDYVRR